MADIKSITLTNKQAAELIRKYDAYGCGYCHQGGEEYPEAFEMAAKALEAEPLLYGDRKQYEKGFSDGYAKGIADANAAQAEAIPLEWIEKQKAECVYGSIPYIALEALLKTWREEKDEATP